MTNTVYMYYCIGHTLYSITYVGNISMRSILLIMSLATEHFQLVIINNFCIVTGYDFGVVYIITQFPRYLNCLIILSEYFPKFKVRK